MGLEKLRFDYWDGPDMVASLIDRWEPVGCRTEKDYENSLYDHLHDSLIEVQVTQQYALGRLRADVAVGDRVFVEIKNDLNSTGEYHRLIGQLTDYADTDRTVLLVLCGKTDKNLLKEVRRQLERLNDGYLYLDQKFHLFEK